MKQFLKNNKHYLLILYFPFYLTAFQMLEKMKPDRIHILDCALDHYIPFVEVFIIPYLLWFIYIGGFGFYFLLRDKESFTRMMYFGMIGMTVFLFISWIYPNGLDLRPVYFERDNIFVDLVQWIYSMDTSTNVLPSIHVFNSVGVCCAVFHSRKLEAKSGIRAGAKLLTLLIILSTMFIKQHSVVDVITALALSYLSWELVYDQGLEKLTATVMEISRLRYRKKRVPRWINK